MLFRNALSFGMRTGFGRPAVLQRCFARNVIKEVYKPLDLKADEKGGQQKEIEVESIQAVAAEAKTDAKVQAEAPAQTDKQKVKPKVERFNRFGSLGFETNIEQLNAGELFDKKSLGKQGSGDDHFYGNRKGASEHKGPKEPKDKKSKKTKEPKSAEVKAQNDEFAAYEEGLAEEEAAELENGRLEKAFKGKGQRKPVDELEQEEQGERKFKFDNKDAKKQFGNKGAKNRPYNNKKDADLDEQEEEEFENFAKERGLTDEQEPHEKSDKKQQNWKFEKSGARFDAPQEKRDRNRNSGSFRGFEEKDQQEQRNNGFRPGSKDYNRQPRYNDIQQGNNYKNNKFDYNRERDRSRDMDRDRSRDMDRDRNRDRDRSRDWDRDRNRDRDRQGSNQQFNNNRFQPNRDRQNSQQRYEEKSKNQLKKEYRQDIQRDKKIEIKGRSPYNNRPLVNRPNEDRSDDPEFMKKRRQPVKSFEAKKARQNETNEPQKDKKPNPPAKNDSADDDGAGY